MAKVETATASSAQIEVPAPDSPDILRLVPGALIQFAVWIAFLLAGIVIAVAMLLLAVRNDGVRTTFSVADWQNIGALLGLLSVPVAFAGSLVAIKLAAAALTTAHRQAEIGDLAVRTAENQEHIQAAAVMLPELLRIEELQAQWAIAANAAWRAWGELLDRLAFEEDQHFMRTDVLTPEEASQITSGKRMTASLLALQDVIRSAIRNPVARNTLSGALVARAREQGFIHAAMQIAALRLAPGERDPSLVSPVELPMLILPDDDRGFTAMANTFRLAGLRQHKPGSLPPETLASGLLALAELAKPEPFSGGIGFMSLQLKRYSPGNDCEARIYLLAVMFGERERVVFHRSVAFLESLDLLLAATSVTDALLAHADTLGMNSPRMKQMIVARINAFSAMELLNPSLLEELQQLREQASIRPDTLGGQRETETVFERIARTRQSRANASESNLQ